MRACARIGAGLVSDAKGFFGLCAAASVVVFLRVLREKVNEDISQRAEVLLLGLGPASPSLRSSPSASSSDVSTLFISGFLKPRKSFNPCLLLKKNKV